MSSLDRLEDGCTKVMKVVVGASASLRACGGLNEMRDAT